jgi:uncharacterized protein DUF6644
MQALLPFFEWCESTWLGETIRKSLISFAVLETFHLLALTVLFGSIIMLSLRLCRITLTNEPVQVLAKELAPWAFWSLIVMIGSGVLLFLSEALKCYASAPFRVKMAFLFTALIFHFTVQRRITRADREPGLFLGAAVGGINFLLWLGVGLGGRAIGFI